MFDFLRDISWLIGIVILCITWFTSRIDSNDDALTAYKASTNQEILTIKSNTNTELVTIKDDIKAIKENHLTHIQKYMEQDILDKKDTDKRIQNIELNVQKILTLLKT